MASCNYIPLNTADIDSLNLYLNDPIDIDIVCIEEGIFINVYDNDETELPGTLALDNPSTEEA